MGHIDFEEHLPSVASSASSFGTDEGYKRDLEDGSTSVDLEEPAPRDPKIVDRDGLDDPANPQNWSTKNKTMSIVLVSLMSFVSYAPFRGKQQGSHLLTIHRPLASSIFAPSIEQVMGGFHSTDQQLASFIVLVYLIGDCFGPLASAPLSEMYGRLPLYNICSVLFVAFKIARAKSPNLAGLIVSRLLSGLADCCPLTLGASTVTDMIPKDKRGVAISSWILGPLLGPVIGPIGEYILNIQGVNRGS